MRRQLNTYKRTLENKKLQSFFFSFMLLFILIVFDMFGIYSLIKITRRRITALSDLKQLVSELKIKGGDINDLKNKLNESKFYLSKLEVAIPKEKNVEAYVVDLADTAAKNGISHRKLYKTAVTDEYVEARVTLQGPSKQIPLFIKDLESFDRLTVVQSFKYGYETGANHLQVVIRMYYLDR